MCKDQLQVNLLYIVPCELLRIPFVTWILLFICYSYLFTEFFIIIIQFVGQPSSDGGI